MAEETGRQPLEHDLKVWPEFFGPITSNLKLFEIRRADRDYRVGDTLLLREWDPGVTAYTGRRTRRVVTYLLDGSGWGLNPDVCILGLAPGWEPIDTVPAEGKVLLANYAPTNWAYWVTTAPFYAADPPRLREMRLKFARGWMPCPPEPFHAG